MATTQLTQIEQAQRELIQFMSGKRMEKLEAAMQGRFDKQQFVRLLLGSCRDEKSMLKLLQCDHASIYKSALEALDYNLVLGGPAQEASLVPFKGKATLIVEYRGWKRLARRHADVDDVEFAAVHNGDEFEFLGTRKEPRHKYSTSKTRRTDPVVGAYAVVYFANGRDRCSYWTVEECMAHRDQYSPSWRHDKTKGNLWHPDNPSFGLMCAKTVFLEMCHRGDCPIELSAREAIERQGETVEPPADEPIEGTAYSSTETVIDSTVVETEDDTGWQFTGLMCLNFQRKVAECKTLAAVGVIREEALSMAQDDDERTYINDTCKVKEADIREARSAKAKAKDPASS